MFIKILLTLLSISLSGFFYRCGGLGSITEEEKKEEKWIPLFLRQSWIRDWVLPAFSLIILFTWWKPDSNYGYLLSIPSYGLMGGTLSTYWDKLTKLWRGDESEYWENWFLHGFFVGLSFFPFIFAGIAWYNVLINALFSGLLMMWISERTGKATLEEFGRGGISAGTRLLLLIK
jgi:hypothetical protein